MSESTGLKVVDFQRCTTVTQVPKNGKVQELIKHTGTLKFNKDARNAEDFESLRGLYIPALKPDYVRTTTFRPSEEGTRLDFEIHDLSKLELPSVATTEPERERWDNVQDLEGVLVLPDTQYLTQFFDGRNHWAVPILSAATHLSNSDVWKRHCSGERVPLPEMAEAIFDALGYPVEKRCSNTAIIRVLNFLLDRLEAVSAFIGPCYYLTEDDVAEVVAFPDEPRVPDFGVTGRKVYQPNETLDVLPIVIDVDAENATKPDGSALFEACQQFAKTFQQISPEMFDRALDKAQQAPGFSDKFVDVCQVFTAATKQLFAETPNAKA